MNIDQVISLFASEGPINVDEETMNTIKEAEKNGMDFWGAVQKKRNELNEFAEMNREKQTPEFLAYQSKYNELVESLKSNLNTASIPYYGEIKTYSLNNEQEQFLKMCKLYGVDVNISRDLQYTNEISR